jgi:predicted cupin superfamily sugar epimerase
VGGGPAPSGREVIDILGLRPHPEGGWFRRTWAAPTAPSGDGDHVRPAATAIYYLLLEGEVARRHRLDADELWHYYLGAPLALTVTDDEDRSTTHVLGPDLLGGEWPQVVVPASRWQEARSTGAFTLVGATVTPGFEYSGWELAPGS